jgi:hypothetical protein
MVPSGQCTHRFLQVVELSDPAALAELARGRLRAKLPALRQALMGRFKRTSRVPDQPVCALQPEVGRALKRLSGESS